MGTLTACLRKAGKNISVDDKNAVLASAAAYRSQGKTNAQAAELAVADLIAKVEALIAAQRAPGAKPAIGPGSPGPGVMLMPNAMPPKSARDLTKPAPSANTVFTDDMAEKARARLKSKLGRLSSSPLDPEMLLDGITLAGYHLEKGARTFAAFARAMVDDLGGGVKPYLKSWYSALRYDPRAQPFTAGMSSAAMVEEFDLNDVGVSSDSNMAQQANNGEQDGNSTATRQLDGTSPGAPEGAPAATVRAPGGGGDAGGASARGGRGDGDRDADADQPGADVAGGMGADAGAAPGPGGRAGGRRADAPAGRVPRAPRADAGPGLFDDAGREGVANPAPNAPPIAANQPTAEEVADFTIEEDLALGEGGQKTKFRNNMAAIRLAKELLANPRTVTGDEQRTLAKYVGWGGLPQAFDAENGDWSREHAELKEALTPEEFDAARRSTRYAHYTSREIIQDGIYAALRRFGFTGGRVLEGGAGVGNFIGLMPTDMRSAGRVTAIEREPIAATIARALYPNQNVQLADFTEFRGQDDFFDAAVGNPPFAADSQVDKSGRKHLSGLSLHNYFFAKEVDMLREGGILAQVVTNSFMDAKGDRARKYIAERTKLLGAIRLPNNAFAKNANTEVTTDIIFLQKRPESEWGGKAAKLEAQEWMESIQYTDPRNTSAKILLNRYFHNHPEMMLGDFGAHGTMYGPDQPALISRPGQDTAALLREAVLKLPEGVYTSVALANSKDAVDAAVRALKNPPVQEGGYFIDPADGKLLQRLPDIAGEPRGKEVTADTLWTAKTKLGDDGFDRIKRLSQMRTTLRGLLAAELSGDPAMDTLRKTLGEEYDAYVKAHGLINDRGTARVFDDDPDFPLLLSLEHNYVPPIGPAEAKKLGIKPVKSRADKSPIFRQRVVDSRKPVTKVESTEDALAVSMAERGRLDTAYIGELLGKSPDEALKELTGGDKALLFLDPSTNEYVLRDAYLSGNVRAKLEQAKAAGLHGNVRALEAVQPEDVGAHEIAAKIGAPWVPTAVYQQFAESLLGDGSKVSISYLKLNSSYSIYAQGASEVNERNTWGTADYKASELLSALLNNRTIKVTRTDGEGKTFTDQDATERANVKAQEIRDRFGDWLFSDSDRSELLVRAYNDTNNNYVTREFDGSWMTFPGKVPDSIIKFRKHQRDAIARIVQDRTTLLDHVVGAGKTFTIVSGAMELRRTGLAKKPMIAVPNHLVKQWAADFYRLYPGANILTATKKDFDKLARRKFLAKAATGDWDAVVIAHSSFGFIQPGAAFETEFNQRQIALLKEAIEDVKGSDAEKTQKRRTVKQLEAMTERLEKRIERLRDKPMDALLDFEEIGVDQLFVDEAHMFKNLMFTTKLQNVAGMGDSQGSQRAYDMYVKTQQVLEQNGRGQGVVFATGTPVSNSLAEKYHMMRYLMPRQMEELGFQSFDAWANTYAEVSQVWMQKPSGDGFKAQNRMSTFVNTHELLKLFDQVADTVTIEDIKRAYKDENDGKDFPIPPLKTGRRIPVSLEKSPAQTAYMEDIAKRAREIEQRKGPPKKGEDNILVLMTDARKAAMDIRLVDPDIIEREPGGRIDRSAAEIMDRYTKYADVKGTQLVFADLGTPIKHAKAELKEFENIRARIDAATEQVKEDALAGVESAIAILEDSEEAEAEMDAKGPDWLTAVKAALRGFSVYDDLKAALIERGMPEAEIAFIHDYNTDEQKAGLFRKVNAGTIRVVLGSTQKMGAGTNVQERLVAEHHLDVPWRPSDVEQREGRIVRQGNALLDQLPGFEVEILAYVTKDTLDMRMWQIQEAKLKMIHQLRTRQIERNVDNAFEDMEMSAGEMQAAATGNMDLLNEIQARNDIKKLEQKRRSFEAQKNDLIGRKKAVAQKLERLPKEIEQAEREVVLGKQYLQELEAKAAEFRVTIDGKEYTDEDAASKYLLAKTEAKYFTRAVEKDGKKVREEMSGEEHAKLKDQLAALRAEGKGDADKEVNALTEKLLGFEEKAAPLDVEMNGTQYTARAKLAEAFSSLRGDRDAIIWKHDGKTHVRRATAALAIQQNVADAIADETEKPVGTVGPFTVMVEGTPRSKFGSRVDILMQAGDTKIEGEIRVGESDTALGVAGEVLEWANRHAKNAGGQLQYRKWDLQAAEKQKAELDKAEELKDWPDQPKLEAAREKHKAILQRLNAADSGDAEPAFRQGDPADRGDASAARVVALQQLVDGITEGWARTPLVQVVGTIADSRVPPSVRAEALERVRKGGGTPKGVIVPGKDGMEVYLFADRLPTEKDVLRVLFHETLGHYGLRGKFGAGLDQVLNQVVALRGPDVSRMLERMGKEPNEANRKRAAEEVLAHMAETQPELTLVQRAIAAIKTWLRENVPMLKSMALSDGEIIRSYILPARRFVQGDGPRGGGQDFGATRPAFEQGPASSEYPRAGAEVSGLRVRSEVPNTESIAASLTEYEELPGIREVPFSDFSGPDAPTARTRKLAQDIEESGEIAPLIVVVGDPRGPYILEGAHRFDALQHMGKATFPAKVVVDQDAAFTQEERRANQRQVQVDGKWRPDSNSTGRPIHPTFAGQLAFWRWFSDSAVVDEQGRPLVVYHGTTGDMDAFDLAFSGSDGVAYDRPAIFATDDPRVASDYARNKRNRNIADAGRAFQRYKNENPGKYDEEYERLFDAYKAAGRKEGWDIGVGANVMPLYLSMQNPLVVDGGGQRFMQVLPDAVKQATEQGHDGVIARNVIDHASPASEYPATVYVAFRPEQIKSATGNAGTFDGGNPDIAFSQEAPLGPNDPRNYLALARQALGDIGTVPGKLHWWHKSVGTQYNLAQKSPAYARVFNAVQSFLQDVSMHATEPANLAPNLLPKLETVRDIVKTPLSAKDTKAIAAPIFEGTLAWTRIDGRPVKVDDLEQAMAQMTSDDMAQQLLRNELLSPNVLAMWRGLSIDQYQQNVATAYRNRVLKPGIVWTRDELRMMFKLDDKQVGYYQEFRAATDKSITDLSISDMVRYAGQDAAAIRADVIATGDIGAAAVLLRARLQDVLDVSPDRAAVLGKTMAKIQEKAARAMELIEKGYAPLSRFGHHTVDVVGADGERLFFSLYESAPEAARAARRFEELAAEGDSEFAGATISRGTVSEEEYKLFAGVSPETIELFGEMLGLDATGDDAADQAFQAYLKLAKASRSSMKRLIHRKGIAGFNEDVGRVLAGFVYSNARMTSRNLHAGEIEDAVRAIPKGQGELKDHAMRMRDYVHNPVEEAQALRGLLFAQYLGGSIASALVNTTQPFTMTLPYLSQFGGIRAAAGHLKEGLAVAFAKSTGDARLDKALLRATEEGIVAPQEVHQLMAQAAGRGALQGGDGSLTGNATAMANNALARLTLLWGKPFSTAELFNRRVTFVAAYKAAVDQKMADPYAFAVQAVTETQGLYNKGNRPRWARGVVGATALTFKQFSISYLELMERMWNAGEPNSPERAAGRRAVFFALGVLMLAGGAGGLPFVEDVGDLVDGFMQRLGYNWNTKNKRQELFEQAFGRGLGHFLEKGVSGLPGVPIDVAGRLGMGNLLPATGALKVKQDRSRDMLEVLGPTGDLAQRVITAGDKAAAGKIIDAGLEVSPVAARNVAKAVEMAATGVYDDTRGYKVLDTTGADAISKAIGFQPKQVARVQEADRTAQEMVALVKLREAQIAGEWAKAIAAGEPAEGRARALEAVADWNEKNPATPIKIKLADVLKRAKNMRMSRSERIEKSAPSEVRAEARRLLRDE